MNLTRKNRIEILVELGQKLQQKDNQFQDAREKAFAENAWFTPENIEQSLDAIVDTFLQKEKLENWADAYAEIKSPKTIGLIMAGNIPLVGFHDFLSVFMSGHKAQIKLSSKDETLMKYFLALLTTISPIASDSIQLVERLENFDAVIATGSNNSSRYFEYYFGKHPNIIRKNRNSVAVLTGKEKEKDFRLLSADVFDYFGLGCRNVTKIYVPEDFDFEPMLAAFELREDVNIHHKYRNNFDYNYAIYLLNKEDILVSKNLILKEDPSLMSRIACLHYEKYEDIEKVRKTCLLDAELIQCISTVNGNLLKLENEVAFGGAQKPGLFDYADGVDTMKFLSELS